MSKFVTDRFETAALLMYCHSDRFMYCVKDNDSRRCVFAFNQPPESDYADMERQLFSEESALISNGLALIDACGRVRKEIAAANERERQKQMRIGA